MAGLLDPTDAALMALGTGLLGGGTFAQALGRGGQGFLSTYAAMQQAQQEKALKERELAMLEQLQKAQIANYESEAAQRKAATEAAAQKQAGLLDWMQRFNSPQAPINAAASAMANGQGPTIANAAQLPQPSPADRMAMLQQGAALGVPGISTLFDIEKWKADPLKMEAGSTYRDRVTGQERTIPRLPEGGQMSGGQFSLLPGYLESMAVLEGAKTRASEGAKAGFDPFTYTPAGASNPVLTTRGAAVSGMNPSNITTNMVGDPAAVRAQIMAQVPPDQRDAVLAAYERQLAGGKGIAIQSEAEKTKATTQATADVKRAEDEKTKVNKAGDMLSVANRAKSILSEGPTGSPLGVARDYALGAFGASTQAGEKAQELRTLSGWLVANVPRMEGPQSNFDVQNYKEMAGDVGNPMLPISRRMAALDEVIRLQNKYAEQGAPQAPKAMPTMRFNPQTGKLEKVQ